MARPRILVACIGNIFLGDDGFGVEVARALAERTLPAEVQLRDFGIRGFDLVYALMDGYDLIIFVDAAPRGERPGTLYVIEPDLSELDQLDPQQLLVEPHGMNPLKVLNMARSMGAGFKKILIVGCEPATLGPEEGQMGLSEPVAAVIGNAADMIESLLGQELNESSVAFANA
jgi:hydrogenase maturation protease